MSGPYLCFNTQLCVIALQQANHLSALDLRRVRKTPQQPKRKKTNFSYKKKLILSNK